MMVSPIFSGVCGLAMYTDRPPGTYDQPTKANMILFMILFTMCLLEVVVIKLIIFDQQIEEFRQTHRRPPASLWFDEDQI